MRTRKPLTRKKPFSGVGAPKRGGKIKVNRKRKAATFTRNFGSAERADFVSLMPCAACGFVGASQNAHVLGNGGMGRKKGPETIAPLCGPRPWLGLVELYRGCHDWFDNDRGSFYEMYPAFQPEFAAARTEEAWQDFLGRGRTR